MDKENIHSMLRDAAYIILNNHKIKLENIDFKWIDISGISGAKESEYAIAEIKINGVTV